MKRGSILIIVATSGLPELYPPIQERKSLGSKVFKTALLLLLCMRSPYIPTLWMGLGFNRVPTSSAVEANLLRQSALLFILVLAGCIPGYLLFAFAAGFNYGGILVIHAS